MKIHDIYGNDLVLTKTELSEVVNPEFTNKTFSKLQLSGLRHSDWGMVKLIGLNGHHEGREWFNATYDLQRTNKFPFIGCHTFSRAIADKILKAVTALTEKKTTPKKKKKGTPKKKK